MQAPLYLCLLSAACGLRPAAANTFSYVSTDETLCHDQEKGVKKQLGESWTSTGCKYATCKKIKSELTGKLEFTIVEYTCPKVDLASLKGLCRQAAGDRRRKTWPECCPRPQCLRDGKRVSLCLNPDHDKAKQTGDFSVAYCSTAAAKRNTGGARTGQSPKRRQSNFRRTSGNRRT